MNPRFKPYLPLFSRLLGDVETTCGILIELARKTSSSLELHQIMQLVELLEPRILELWNDRPLEEKKQTELFTDYYAITAKKLLKSDSREEGLGWALKAAERGSVKGMVLFGTFQPNVSWLKKAAESGDADAMSNLGTFYKNKNKKALRWFHKAAKVKHSPSMFNLGREYFHARNLKKSIYWFEQAAKQGDKSAMAMLSCLYSNYLNNEKQATAWAQTVAEQGDPLGQILYGFRLLTGLGIAVNKEAALEEFKKAAKQNYGMADYLLGLAYLDGKNTVRNIKLARHHLLEAKAQHVEGSSLALIFYSKEIELKPDTVATSLKEALEITDAPFISEENLSMYSYTRGNLLPSGSAPASFMSGSSSKISTIDHKAILSETKLPVTTLSESSPSDNPETEKRKTSWNKNPYRNLLDEMEFDIFNLQRCIDKSLIDFSHQKKLKELKEKLNELVEDIQQMFALMCDDKNKKTQEWADAELRRLHSKFHTLKELVDGRLSKLIEKSPHQLPREAKVFREAPFYFSEKPRLVGLSLLKDALLELKKEITNPKPCITPSDYLEKAYALWGVIGLTMETLRYFRDDPKYFSSYDARIDQIRNAIYHSISLFANLTPERIMSHLDEIKEAHQSAQAILECLDPQIKALEVGVPMTWGMLDSAVSHCKKLKDLLADKISENPSAQKRATEKIVSQITRLDTRDSRSLHMAGLACARMGAASTNPRIRKVCNRLRHFLENGITPETLPGLIKDAHAMCLTRVGKGDSLEYKHDVSLATIR